MLLVDQNGFVKSHQLVMCFVFFPEAAVGRKD